MVRMQNGGGLCKRQMSRETTLSSIFEDMKEIYFPNGKSRCKGSFSLLDAHICGADFQKIRDLDLTMDKYMHKNALRSCRLVLMLMFSFEWSSDYEYFSSTEKHSCSCPESTGTPIHMASQPSVSNGEDDSGQMQVESQTSATQQLIAVGESCYSTFVGEGRQRLQREQETAFQKSLEADQMK